MNTIIEAGTQKKRVPSSPHVMLKSNDTYKPNTQTAVRDYMVNNLGLDNNKIGYNNGNVTYNGTSFLKPSYVNNGKSYATSTEIESALNAYKARDLATVPVRKKMVEDGFLNDQIGWNSKTNNITYYGQDIGAPGRLENGTSYLTPEAYDSIKKKITEDNVLLTDYAASKGIGNAVSYNQTDNTVTLYGQKIPIQQIKTDGYNNYAYIKKSDFDRINNEYMINNPTTGAAYNALTLYNNKIKKAADEVSGRHPFTYDLESDPAYKAYYEAAVRNGNKAYEDTLAHNAAMTGGYANSNAVVAAQQAKNAYLDSLNDRIPQLYQAAYERYNQDHNNNLNTLSALNSTASNVFSNELQAAAYINQILNDNYNRKNTEYGKEVQKEATEYERALAERQLKNSDFWNVINTYLQNPYYVNEAYRLVPQMLY